MKVFHVFHCDIAGNPVNCKSIGEENRSNKKQERNKEGNSVDYQFFMSIGFFEWFVDLDKLLINT